MAQLAFVEAENGVDFDAVVEVEFAEPLGPAQTVALLALLAEIYTTELAMLCGHDITAITITAHRLMLRLRFERARLAQPAVIVGEDTSRLHVQFIFFMFATIDCAFPLGTVPFPPDFRMWLDLPRHVHLG